MARYNPFQPSAYDKTGDHITSLPRSDPRRYQSSSLTRETSDGRGCYNSSSAVANDLSFRTCKIHSPEHYRMLEKRKMLPIWSYKSTVITHILSNQVLIIEGDTGSGKSTQVPQWCLELPGIKQVVCTQPRRIAAISLAQRVAQEMDVRVGQEVGYIVRFDRKVSSKTSLKYVTDGILLRQAIQDRILSSFDIIIIDEAHERRTVTDILLGVIKDTLPHRPDLKLIIMSATLNLNKFCEFFYYCSHLRIPGKLYPVETIYLPKVISQFPGRNNTDNFVNYAINVAFDVCVNNKTEGDILIFVTGRGEINSICRSLAELLGKADLGNYIDIIPLFGDLPYNSQQRVFGPAPSSTIGRIGRKCIVSTNIAETSITIEGVVFVIDSGKVKLSNLAAGGHMKSLLPEDISQSSANQRAGRAGRTRPGICYRLFSESKFHKMSKDTIPEILRCDLSDVILHLKALRINIEEFQSIDPPTFGAFENAIYNLQVLGALDPQRNVTTVGSQMTMFPVEPEVARMLIASKDYSCQEEILTLAAMLSGDRPGSVFIRVEKDTDKVQQIQSKLHHSSGDHLTYINVYNEFISNGCCGDWCQDNYVNYKILGEAEKIRNQLLGIMTELKLITYYDISLYCDNISNIMKAILTGFICNIAQLDPQSNGLTDKRKFITVRSGIPAIFHPSCVHSSRLPEPLVCYCSCIRTNLLQNYLSMVSYIEEQWYDEIRGNQLIQGQTVRAPALKKIVTKSSGIASKFSKLSLSDK